MGWSILLLLIVLGVAGLIIFSMIDELKEIEKDKHSAYWFWFGPGRKKK